MNGIALGAAAKSFVHRTLRVATKPKALIVGTFAGVGLVLLGSATIHSVPQSEFQCPHPVIDNTCVLGPGELKPASPAVQAQLNLGVGEVIGGGALYLISSLTLVDSIARKQYERRRQATATAEPSIND